MEKRDKKQKRKSAEDIGGNMMMIPFRTKRQRSQVHTKQCSRIRKHNAFVLKKLWLSCESPLATGILVVYDEMYLSLKETETSYSR